MRRLFPVTAVLILALVAATLWFSGLRDYLSFAFIQSSGESLREWLDARPVTGKLAFFMFYTLLILLCIPAVAITILAAGYFFGFWAGAALVLTASVTGAALLFLLARSSLGGVLRKYAVKFYDRYAAPMRRDAFHYMIFLRLIPGMPSSVANILPALFDVPLKTFMAATTIGLLPAITVLVYLGQALGTVESLSDLFTPQIAAGFFLLALLALGPVAARKIREIRTRRAQQ